MTDPLSILHGLSLLGSSKVEEPDINKLFLSVAEHAGKDVRAEKEIFSALVKSTLKYRDHMRKSEGIVVTVEDVRVALNWLLPALATGKLPGSNNRLRLGLLKIWLDEIKLTAS